MLCTSERGKRLLLRTTVIREDWLWKAENINYKKQRCCSLCWKLTENEQSFVFFWQIVTERIKATFLLVNKNARNAIERCAPSDLQKHITKESGFHNHSTPLTMFARLPHWHAHNMLATRQSWATSVTWVVYEGNKDKTANFHFPF